MNSILSNAVAAIRLGVEDYQSSDPDRVLSAVRNLTAGILLLFKEKLRALSPIDSDEVLLKERVRPVRTPDGKICFVGAGRKTVDAQQIKERFESLAVSAEWKRFDELLRLRNELEHYYTTSGRGAVAGALSDAFAVLQRFVTVELKLEPVDLLGTSTWHTLLSEARVYEAQLASCQEELASINWPHAVYSTVAAEIRCIHCRSELLKPTNAGEEALSLLEFTCTSCGRQAGFEDVVGDAVAEAFAGEAYVAMTDGGEPPLGDCHECGQESFHYESGFCLLCQAELSYTECTVCHAALGPDEQDYDGLCGYHKSTFDKDD